MLFHPPSTQKNVKIKIYEYPGFVYRFWNHYNKKIQTSKSCYKLGSLIIKKYEVQKFQLLQYLHIPVPQSEQH